MTKKRPFILSFLKWFFIVAIGIAFLPITVGILLLWLILKKVNNKKLKIALAVIVAIPTLFFGSAFIYTITHPSPIPPKVVQQTAEPKVAGENTEASLNTTPTETPTAGVAVIESTPAPTPTPSPKPTAIATKVPTPKPTIYIAPTTTPVVNMGGGYACNCSKTCEQISSCAEAQYQLNVCGCKVRDGDKDGIACDTTPGLHCQN